MAKEYFGCGTIRPKPGNPDVLVYSILSRRLVSERVVPFLDQRSDFSARNADFDRTREGLATIVRLACSMNMDGKQCKRPLADVLGRILRGHMPGAPGRSEDMVRPPWRRGELGGIQTT
jgi:hypothetical protein